VERTLATALLLGWEVHTGLPAFSTQTGDHMKVKFKVSCAGNHFGYVQGREYVIDDDLAMGFIRCNYATPVEPEVRVADAPPVERKAVLPTFKKKE
jgi:hypothetical protein